VDTDGSRTLDFFEFTFLSFMMTQNGACPLTPHPSTPDHKHKLVSTECRDV
jgi:hypothetical protein